MQITSKHDIAFVEKRIKELCKLLRLEQATPANANRIYEESRGKRTKEMYEVNLRIYLEELEWIRTKR